MCYYTIDVHTLTAIRIFWTKNVRFRTDPKSCAYASGPATKTKTTFLNPVKPSDLKILTSSNVRTKTLTKPYSPTDHRRKTY